MEDIIIPIVILAVLGSVVLYSCLVVASRESRKEEKELCGKERQAYELETGIEGRTPRV